MEKVTYSGAARLQTGDFGSARNGEFVLRGTAYKWGRGEHRFSAALRKIVRICVCGPNRVTCNRRKELRNVKISTLQEIVFIYFIYLSFIHSHYQQLVLYAYVGQNKMAVRGPKGAI